MHQSHNIPWHLLQEHIKLTHHSKPVDPKTGHPCQPRYPYTHVLGYTLEPRKKPNQSGALNHFVRKLVSSIEEFSRTERSKYPADTVKDIAHPDVGPLVSEEKWQQMISFASFRFLSSDPPRMNCVEDWISKFKELHGLPQDYSKIVKGLIAIDEVETILMLISHPDLNRDEVIESDGDTQRPGSHHVIHINALERLSTIPQAYDYGWADIGRISLELYILLNLMATMKAEYENKDGPHWYRKLNKYRQVCSNIHTVRTWLWSPQPPRIQATDTEGNEVPQQESMKPHEALLLSSNDFWRHRPYDVPLPSDPLAIPSSTASILQRQEEIMQENDLLSDAQALHGYLSRLFRFIYVTDMAMKECGRTIDWKVEATVFLSSIITGLQSEWKTMNEEYTNVFK